MGANWTAELTGVSVQSSAISGAGTITFGQVNQQIWNVALSGRTESDTHAMLRMDMTPATDPSLPSFTVFCEADLASTSSIDGYVATASPPVSNAVMLVGSALRAQKH